MVNCKFYVAIKVIINCAPVMRPLGEVIFSAVIVPPRAVMICLQMARPRPECSPKLSVFGRSE